VPWGEHDSVLLKVNAVFECVGSTYVIPAGGASTDVARSIA
jgi:hypothetical protein